MSDSREGAWTVRRAAPGDARALAELRLEFMRIVKTEGLPGAEALRRRIESRIAAGIAANPAAVFVCEAPAVADRQGAAVSRASAGTAPIAAAGEIAFHPGGVAEIAYLHTLPEWRRQGMGGALVRAMIDECAARGAKKIVLRPYDGGRTIYDRAGFRTVAASGAMELLPGGP